MRMMTFIRTDLYCLLLVLLPLPHPHPPPFPLSPDPIPSFLLHIHIAKPQPSTQPAIYSQATAIRLCLIAPRASSTEALVACCLMHWWSIFRGIQLCESYSCDFLACFEVLPRSLGIGRRPLAPCCGVHTTLCGLRISSESGVYSVDLVFSWVL